LRHSQRFISGLILIIVLAAARPVGASGCCELPSFFNPLSVQDTNAEIARLAARLRSSDEEERRDAALQLGAIEKPEAAPALKSALSDSSPRVRVIAIRGLSMLGDAEFIPLIAAPLAQDKVPFVRKSAAYALGRFHRSEATPALVAALTDKDAEVRSAATIALTEYTDAAAIAPLTGALSDKSNFVRAHAARALGLNGRAAAQAVPALITLLTTDEGPEVRRQAATALGNIGDRAALPALERARYSADPYLSEAALAAIKLLTGSSRQ